MPNTTQPSRSAEARKARRVIREALRLSMVLASDDQTEIHEASQERLDAIEEVLEESIHLMATLKANRDNGRPLPSKKAVEAAAPAKKARKAKAAPAAEVVAEPVVEVVAAPTTTRRRKAA